MTVQSQFQIFSDKYLSRVRGPIMLCSRYKSKVPLLCPSSRSIEGRNIREGISVISNSLKKMPHNAADSVNIVFHFCLSCRPLRDPGISRDPGIFSKSQSRESQKSNPGIFRDFQKPLNDCIPRLSTTLIDHNRFF